MYVHPFAEEMNKSRRMAAVQARALAAAGYAVLQMDLTGCGDSSGDFGDASWGDWVSDVVLGCEWLSQRSGAPLWIWGLRAGCLLAVEAARQIDAPCNFLFWAPTVAGRTQWQQFMRLKLAGDMLEGASKGAMQELRQQLAAGSCIEIAGYTVAPALASGLENAALSPGVSGTGDGSASRVEWFEMTTRPDATLSPVTQKTAIGWSNAGYLVRMHLVQGPSFWQTAEIEDAPLLVDATLRAVGELVTANVVDP
jgi:exosortase A-associated hydrolase 2